MERLQNQKEQLYEDQKRVQEIIKQRREEQQSECLKIRKQKIFDKIWKSKYSHQKPKQKLEIKEEVGNRYARVDQRYKLTRRKDRKHCWYCGSISHLKAKCPKIR